MTNEYDFILSSIRYSFSSVDCFNTCKHSFLLQYIFAKDRTGNFFGDYGKFLHSIMEKYFRRELVEFELPSYYVDHYNEKVISSPPPYPANMAENYYNDGLEFLNNIDFDLDAYDFISSEEMIENVFNGIEMVVKPDIILYERATHQYVLLDFKTSKLSGKKSADQKKIDEYKKQLYLYVYFIEKFKNVKIEKILLWFVRNQQIVEIPIDTNQVLSTVEWFENTIRELKNEKNWEANLDKKNNYFCSWLCQMRETCEPRQKLLNDQS